MTKRLAILGASGHGKVIADIAIANGIGDIVFYDDRYEEQSTHYGFPVVGGIEHAISASPSDYDMAVVAIGNATLRANIQAKLQRVTPALVHPQAYVSASAKLGAGTVVMPQAVVNADTIVGEGVIINSGAVVEHDCILGDYSHICPNAAIAGGVSIGAASWIGIGSAVIQLIKIGDNVTIGAGSVVIRDVACSQTLVGNPATVIKR